MYTIFYRQMKRSRQAVVIAALLTILTGFFTLSANLYYNSVANIQIADETYSTIAVMELYGWVDRYGSLINGDTNTAVGYLPTIVDDYDMNPVFNSPYVENYDLRARYGAYIEDAMPIRAKEVNGTGQTIPFWREDLIRFEVESEDPVELVINTMDAEQFNMTEVKINILESASGTFDYQLTQTVCVECPYDDVGVYGKEIRRINRADDVDSIDSVILYPNVEYVGTVIVDNINQLSKPFTQGGRAKIDMLRFFPDCYTLDYRLSYSENRGEYLTYETPEGQPFWLHRWDDVQADTSLSSYYEQLKDAYWINAHSFGVIATNNISGYPAFHLGNTYMQAGRMISEEEYEQGCNVCVVSDLIAEAQGWSVGQQLNLGLYTYDGFLNDTFATPELTPVFTDRTAGLFHSAMYEIVGIYSEREWAGTSEISESALSLPWNAILIPTASVKEPAEQIQPIHGSLLTIWIENGKAAVFLEEMRQAGIMEQAQGQYEARFTIYDQGYSSVQSGLVSLSATAELLLLLSTLFLVATAVVTALLYARSQKRNFGIMRMLGCSTKRATAAVWLGGLLISLPGAGLGSFIGHMLTSRVGSVLLLGDEDAKLNALFSTFLAFDQSVSITYETGAHLFLSVIAAGISVVLFTALLLLAVSFWRKKEPRELLPKVKGGAE